MGSGSTRPNRSGSSASLSGFTGRKNILVPAWAWQSVSASWSVITDACGPKATKAPGRHFSFPFRRPTVSKTIRIFLAEDNPADVDLVKVALHEYHIDHEL